jgi:signal transduction histidine kinase
MKIHKKSLRLATLYLAIIAAISILFSVVIYQLSIQELERGLRRPSLVLSRGQIRMSQEINDDLSKERLAYFEEARIRVLQKLVLINLLILAAGGVLSYYLAERSLRPIEEAHEAQSRFTADASHELRTPITAMLTENEVALLDDKLTAKQAKEILQSNNEELNKLSMLIDGLLRLAGHENSSLLKEKVSVNEIIKSAIDRLEKMAVESKINIEYLPLKKDQIITADRNSIEEALVIILENALKYSHRQSKIEVIANCQKSLCNIAVKDNGVGINSVDLPLIFDRFYRADKSRTKQDVGGYGLGLSIAQDIVNKHGGTITVTSKPSKGSTFTIHIPC